MTTTEHSRSTATDDDAGDTGSAPAPVAPAPAPPPVTAQAADGNGTSGLVTGALFWAFVIGMITLTNDTLRGYLTRWWWAVLVVVGLIALSLLMPRGRRWLAERSPVTRAALVMFGLVPLLVAGVGSVAVLPPASQLTVLRVVFLLVVCLLPATMWYLFIATRKASLLNEFLTNLRRLGLLGRVGDETEPARERRIAGYLQRFEAVYGDLPPAVRDDIAQGRFAWYARSDAGGHAALTTTIPVVMSTVLITLGWLVTLPPAEHLAGGAALDPGAFVPTVSPVSLAFLGAYFFSLQMLFRRYVLKDLHGSAYVAVAMRIILAVIGTWVLVGVGPPLLGLTAEQLLVAGFVLGVFPRVLWQVVESVFKRIARITLPSMRSDLPLSDLDGLTVWHESRLEEEDVENLPNMATADLVELLLTTRLAPEQVIDWTDQAILYTQLGPRRKAGDPHGPLRAHGVRTATSFLRAVESAERRGARPAFEKILPDGATTVPALIAALGTNSNLELIERWRAAVPHREPPSC